MIRYILYYILLPLSSVNHNVMMAFFCKKLEIVLKYYFGKN